MLKALPMPLIILKAWFGLLGVNRSNDPFLQHSGTNREADS